MGHVARVVEEAGIPTVVVMIRAFRHRAKEMKLPRTVVTRHMMGRPLGAPGDVKRQRGIILAALELLENAKEGGTIVELPESYRLRPLY